MHTADTVQRNHCLATTAKATTVCPRTSSARSEKTTHRGVCLCWQQLQVSSGATDREPCACHRAKGLETSGTCGKVPASGMGQLGQMRGEVGEQKKQSSKDCPRDLLGFKLMERWLSSIEEQSRSRL